MGSLIVLNPRLSIVRGTFIIGSWQLAHSPYSTMLAVMEVYFSLWGVASARVLLNAIAPVGQK